MYKIVVSHSTGTVYASVQDKWTALHLARGTFRAYSELSTVRVYKGRALILELTARA